MSTSSVGGRMRTGVPMCAPSDSVEEARRRIGDSTSPVLVVVVGDCNRVVGVIPRQALFSCSPDCCVDRVMNRKVASCHPEDTVEWAVREASATGSDCLTVVDWTDELLGIVTRADLANPATDSAPGPVR